MFLLVIFSQLRASLGQNTLFIPYRNLYINLLYLPSILVYAGEIPFARSCLRYGPRGAMQQPPLTCGFCGTGNRHGWVFDSHWSTYYRAIYCIGSNTNEPRLSGLAYYRDQDEKNYLPPETYQRYDDLHLDPLSLITIQSVTPPGPDIPESDKIRYAWGFRFHESCWRLIEQASVPQPVNLKMLWRILRSVPHSSHLPFWGHNFGGLYSGARRTYQTGNHFVLLGGVSNRELFSE